MPNNIIYVFKHKQYTYYNFMTKATQYEQILRLIKKIIIFPATRLSFSWGHRLGQGTEHCAVIGLRLETTEREKGEGGGRNDP